jgi:hypothetical protein
MGPIRLADDAGASPVRAPHAVKESNPARSVLETNLLPEHGIEVVDMEGNAPSRTCLQGTAPAFRTRPLGCATGLVHSEWTRLFVLAHSPRVRNRTCVSRSSGENSAIELRVDWLVGAAGFEPATTRLRTGDSSRLSYTPMMSL